MSTVSELNLLSHFDLMKHIMSGTQLAGPVLRRFQGTIACLSILSKQPWACRS